MEINKSGYSENANRTKLGSYWNSGVVAFLIFFCFLTFQQKSYVAVEKSRDSENAVR